MPEQVTFIEAALVAKSPKFRHYNVSFLPVNEIENFAILANPVFSNEQIKQNEQIYEAAKDACFDTANSNLEKCRKVYLNPQSPDGDKHLFMNSRAKEMRNKAKEDPIRFCRVKIYVN